MNIVGGRDGVDVHSIECEEDTDGAEEHKEGFEEWLAEQTERARLDGREPESAASQVQLEPGTRSREEPGGEARLGARDAGRERGQPERNRGLLGTAQAGRERINSRAGPRRRDSEVRRRSKQVGIKRKARWSQPSVRLDTDNSRASWGAVAGEVESERSTETQKVAREIVAARYTRRHFPPLKWDDWAPWHDLALQELSICPAARAAFLRAGHYPGVWTKAAMLRLRRVPAEEWEKRLQEDPDGVSAQLYKDAAGIKRGEGERFAASKATSKRRKPRMQEWPARITRAEALQRHWAPDIIAATEQDNEPEDLLSACRRQAEKPMRQRLQTELLNGTRSEGDLRICTYNVNGMWPDKFVQLMVFMQEYHIDVLICIDTRVSLRAAKEYGKVAIESLGLGTWTGACDFGRARPTRKRANTIAVGGQLIVVAPKYGAAVRDFKADWTGMGVASKFTLPAQGGRIMVVGTYWPTPGTGDKDSNRLCDRIQQELSIRGNHERPIPLIRNIIGRWRDKHMSTAGNSILIAGDLNSSWGNTGVGTYKGLMTWADELGLVNGPLDVNQGRPPLLTRLPQTGNPKGSMVDHILLGSPDGSVTTVGAWVHAGPVWRIMSDHYPLVAEFSIKGGRGDEGLVLPGDRPPGGEWDRIGPHG